ncbi:hypothetical protein DICVIV_05693 [Dictyocaulus viviparus]|uniref:Uncharacterized protein n=1 Tax=Dictyocaulus viviparus TaxID=29172 RepID=A0A0D8XWU6_DICVI|nr:hypothetical protein DICVIV_05693 [Dictyocaulus viviparus]
MVEFSVLGKLHHIASRITSSPITIAISTTTATASATAGAVYMKQFLVLLLLFFTISVVLPSPPPLATRLRPRRNMEALERIMKEMLEIGAVANGPGFRPGR